MSRSTSEGNSQARSHSRDRGAAVAAIIDSLHGTDSRNPDTPDEAAEANAPLGQSDLTHDSALSSSGPTDQSVASPPVPPPAIQVEPAVDSDLQPPSPPPPPPPPPTVQADSTVETSTDQLTPPPPTALAGSVFEMDVDQPPPPPPVVPADTAVELEPPPPPPMVGTESAVTPEPQVRADFASSSAMVKDILSAGPDAEPDEEGAGNPGPKQRSASSDQAQGAPLASDFFTTPKPKRRIWHRK
jgi:hypothetical protein